MAKDIWAKRIFDYELKGNTIYVCVYLYCNEQAFSYAMQKMPYFVPDNAYITPRNIDGVRRLQIAGTDTDVTDLNARLAEVETKIRGIMRDNETPIPRRRQLIKDMFYQDTINILINAKANQVGANGF